MQLSRFSPANLSIKHRLPLLIGTLLLGIILASTWASYNGVKESAFDVGRERLQNLTKQLAILLQQSNNLFLAKSFTAANQPAIKAFLQSPSAANRTGASLILQQLEAPQDQNSLQIELWNANHSLVLSVPDGASPESLDLETEFKAAAVGPFKTTGPMRVVKDIITAPGVVAVNDDAGKPIGYLVRWRRMTINPPPKQLTDLLGSEATLYFGNNHGDLLTNLDRIVSKPRADLGATGEVMQYSRDGNRVLALGRPINGTPWFVAIEFPEQPLLTPAHRFLRRILLIGIAVFISGIGCAFALSRGITRPLHSLTRAAAAISGGDYSQTVDVPRSDELGLLAAGFNAMTDKVRTSQRELEEHIQALSDSEQRLQTVIENLSEGLVVSDLNGQLLNWNQAALEIHGFDSLSECLLKLPDFANIFELSSLDGSVLDLEQWPLPRIIRGERLRNVEVRIRRLDSDWNRVFNYGGSIVREASGRLAAIVTMSDITERKQAEREIRRLNEELEQRVAQRTAQLEAANKELEAFSYSVSHDLRAPLRHINGFSQALLEDYEDKLDATGKKYLHEVRHASHEMAQLIDDVLQLARVTRSEMRHEPVDLSELAAGVLTELEKGEAGRAVGLNIDEGLLTHGDKRLLRIVLTNLLGNAWKFTGKTDHPEIVFGEAKSNGENCFYVRDNGAGFDMAYVNKLFGAFQRLHTAGEFEGTGIGLATVQRIINRHGGRVWAEGAVNGGATFFFTLPNFKETGDGQQSDPTS